MVMNWPGAAFLVLRYLPPPSFPRDGISDLLICLPTEHIHSAPRHKHSVIHAKFVCPIFDVRDAYDAMSVAGLHDTAIYVLMEINQRHHRCTYMLT